MNQRPVSAAFFKGIALISGGILLLLHTLGLLQKGTSLLLIVISIAAIGYGLIESGIYEYLFGLIKRIFKK